MKRRGFLKGALACAPTALILEIPSESISSVKSVRDRKTQLMIDKVKMAMLAMQRAPWEQGVAVQSMLELGENDLVILMAKEAALRQSADGRLGMLGGGESVTDPASNGEAVLLAAKLTGDESLRKAADMMLDYLMNKAPKTADGALFHFRNRQWVWVDSIYMAPPFLAAAGKHAEAVKQIEGFRKLLWNPDKKLFSHQWDDGKKEFIRKDFWGVGNGWAAAGMARIINALPKEMAEEKKRLILYVKEVIDGCVNYMRADGFFHDVVDKPDTFIETNLAQMLAYTIYRGTGAGWLENNYRKYADKMRTASHSKVDRYGLVQGVCGSPRFNSPGTATEGQAFFILMEAAYSSS